MTGHPVWCSPNQCSATDATLPLEGGEHRSEPIHLDQIRVFTRRGSVPATVAYLTSAACPWKTDTFLHLANDEDDLSVPVREAAGLLAQLNELVARDEH